MAFSFSVHVFCVLGWLVLLFPVCFDSRFIVFHLIFDVIIPLSTFNSPPVV